MINEKLETRIAMETAAGREGLTVWWQTLNRMSGPQRMSKAFELSETARRIMRDGIQNQNPEATDEEIQAIYVERMLSIHGLSLDEIRKRQSAQESV